MLSDQSNNQTNGFDRVNAALAAFVLIGTFIVYALTVQRSFSYWDCGEFIACASILGIPHPPGFPLFVILGRIAAMIPFVEDVSYRINYISVISSSVTAMFSYLLTVKLARYFFADRARSGLNRFIVYAGGIAGGFFVAFGATNWSNSVEAEVYGLGLALSVAIVWLTIKFYENRGTLHAARLLVLAMFLAMLGIGIHMTVFLVVPICAIFYMFDKEANWKDYLIVCSFAIIELLLVILLANGRGGETMFKLISVALGLVMVWMLYKRINWGILIAVITCSTVMISFSLFFWALPIGTLAVIALGQLGKRFGFKVQWKTALAIILIGVLGFSVHLFIPIRSSLNPRIDENNPSRDLRTFINFLDRKQYGSVSMVDRMFSRRGEWSNQFGRHANMGFWSYFEVQYSRGGWNFIPFLALGLLGAVVAIRKRLEIGMPFMVLLLLCSVGLILYMNFADGMHYDARTTDAYLEVRNRDYFFTPAFVFFGIAMGMGVSALMGIIRERVEGLSARNMIVYGSGVLMLLPGFALAGNYHKSDRSKNNLPYFYAKNILDTCEPNAILFTSGDNDTFSLWCLQETYNYRKDVAVVNLSLLNTDWYVEQMKERFDVPISLTREQTRWNPYQRPDGIWTQRPAKQFYDRPRGRNAYMVAAAWNGGVIRVQDMMTDEIILQNGFKRPIYFSGVPYAESPLGLRERSVHVAQLFKLELNPDPRLIDVEKGYDLYVNKYRFDGMESSEVYRDEAATGNAIGLGLSSLRIYDELIRMGDTTRAVNLMEHLTKVYPEYWQAYTTLSELAQAKGDTAGAVEILQTGLDTLTAFLATNEENFYYRMDVGNLKTDIGLITGDTALVNEGLDTMWEGFMINPNSGFSFRKMVMALSRAGKYDQLAAVAREHAKYKINLTNPILQQILGIAPQGSYAPPAP